MLGSHSDHIPEKSWWGLGWSRGYSTNTLITSAVSDQLSQGWFAVVCRGVRGCGSVHLGMFERGCVDLVEAAGGIQHSEDWGVSDRPSGARVVSGGRSAVWALCWWRLGWLRCGRRRQ